VVIECAKQSDADQTLSDQKPGAKKRVFKTLNEPLWM
jgi:hypothetical protein